MTMPVDSTGSGSLTLDEIAKTPDEVLAKRYNLSTGPAEGASATPVSVNRPLSLDEIATTPDDVLAKRYNLSPASPPTDTGPALRNFYAARPAMGPFSPEQVVRQKLGEATFAHVDQIFRNAGISTYAWTHNANRESGGNTRAVGDNGSSFGLFQLHRGGLLGNMSPQDAQDPVKAARVLAQEAWKQGVHQVKDPLAQAYAFTERVERPAAAVLAQVRKELLGSGAARPAASAPPTAVPPPTAPTVKPSAAPTATAPLTGKPVPVPPSAVPATPTVPAPAAPNPTALQQTQQELHRLALRAQELNAILKREPVGSKNARDAYVELHNTPTGQPPDPNSVNGRYLAAKVRLAQLQGQRLPATEAYAKGQVYGPPPPPAAVAPTAQGPAPTPRRSLGDVAADALHGSYALGEYLTGQADHLLRHYVPGLVNSGPAQDLAALPGPAAALRNEPALPPGTFDPLSYDAAAPRSAYRKIVTSIPEMVAGNTVEHILGDRSVQAYAAQVAAGQAPSLKLSDDPQQRAAQVAELKKLQPVINGSFVKGPGVGTSGFVDAMDARARREIPQEYYPVSGPKGSGQRNQSEQNLSVVARYLTPENLQTFLAKQGVKLTPLQQAALPALAAGARQRFLDTHEGAVSAAGKDVALWELGGKASELAGGALKGSGDALLSRAAAKLGPEAASSLVRGADAVAEHPLARFATKTTQRAIVGGATGAALQTVSDLPNPDLTIQERLQHVKQGAKQGALVSVAHGILAPGHEPTPSAAPQGLPAPEPKVALTPEAQAQVTANAARRAAQGQRFAAPATPPAAPQGTWEPYVTPTGQAQFSKASATTRAQRLQAQRPDIPARARPVDPAAPNGAHVVERFIAPLEEANPAPTPAAKPPATPASPAGPVPGDTVLVRGQEHLGPLEWQQTARGKAVLRRPGQPDGTPITARVEDLVSASAPANTPTVSTPVASPAPASNPRPKQPKSRMMQPGDVPHTGPNPNAPPPTSPVREVIPGSPDEFAVVTPAAPPEAAPAPPSPVASAASKPPAVAPVAPADPLLESAARFVVASGDAGPAALRQKFGLSPGQISDLLDSLEQRGVVGPHQGVRPREVLADRAAVDRMFASAEPPAPATAAEPAAKIPQGAKSGFGFTPGDRVTIKGDLDRNGQPREHVVQNVRAQQGVVEVLPVGGKQRVLARPEDVTAVQAHATPVAKANPETIPETTHDTERKVLAPAPTPGAVPGNAAAQPGAGGASGRAGGDGDLPGSPAAAGRAFVHPDTAELHLPGREPVSAAATADLRDLAAAAREGQPAIRALQDRWGDERFMQVRTLAAELRQQGLLLDAQRAFRAAAAPEAAPPAPAAARPTPAAGSLPSARDYHISRKGRLRLGEESPLAAQETSDLTEFQAHADAQPQLAADASLEALQQRLGRERFERAQELAEHPAAAAGARELLQRRADAQARELTAARRETDAHGDTGRKLVQEAASLGGVVTHTANGRTLTYYDLSDRTDAERQEILETIRTDARERRSYPTPNSEGHSLSDLVLGEKLLPADAVRRGEGPALPKWDTETGKPLTTSRGIFQPVTVKDPEGPRTYSVRVDDGKGKRVLTDTQARKLALAQHEQHVATTRGGAGPGPAGEKASEAGAPPPLTQARNEQELAAALRHHFNLSEPEAEASAAIAQARAETWAKQTGRKPEEWYQTRLAGVTSGGKPGPLALYQMAPYEGNYRYDTAPPEDAAPSARAATRARDLSAAEQRDRESIGRSRPTATYAHPDSFRGLQPKDTVEVDGETYRALQRRSDGSLIVEHVQNGTKHVLSLGAEMPAQPNLLYQDAAHAPPFYSQAERVISSKMGGRASAKEVDAMLRANGVKPEELKWSGLDDFLAAKRAKGLAVKKDEVLEFLRANNVQVQEVVKGEDVPRPGRDREVWFEDSAGNRVPIHAEESVADPRSGYREDVAAQRGRWIDADGNALSEADALQRARESTGYHSKANEPKFTQADLRLPGGENYRELLLTLPGKAPNSDVERASDAYFAAVKQQREYSERILDGEPRVPAEIQRLSAAVRETGAAWEAEKAKKPLPYRSSHWDEPNVLAHVRFDERSDAQGRRVLHVAEIQSDWGNAGAERGFRDQRPADEARLAEVQAEAEKLGGDPAKAARVAQLQQEAGRLQKRLTTGTYDTPTGPLVGDQNAWASLAMKRMLRYAAENGFDRVTWDTGETNAERFDLSQRIEELRYLKNADGSYDLNASTKGDRRLVDVGSRIPEAKLADHVGKETADKIIAGEGVAATQSHPNGWQRLLNQDLKVGGAGKKAIYDQILPAAANKLGKKFGATVGEAEVVTQRAETGPPEDDGAGGLVRRRGGAVQTAAAHALDITPAMRDSVLREGQPLFQQEGAQPKAATEFLPDQRAILRGLQAPDVSSAVHELGHVFRRDLDGDDLAIAEKWAGVSDGQWERAHEEKFARGFERYLRDGKAPSLGMARVFAQFKQWLGSIYRTVKGSAIDVEIHPEMRGVYGRLLGGEAEPGGAKPRESTPTTSGAAERSPANSESVPSGPEIPAPSRITRPRKDAFADGERVTARTSQGTLFKANVVSTHGGGRRIKLVAENGKTVYADARDVRHEGDTFRAIAPLPDAPHPLAASVAEHYDRALRSGATGGEPLALGRPTPESAAAVMADTGVDISRKERIIHPDWVRHSQRQHGVGNETRGEHIGVERKDWELVPHVLDAPDEVVQETINGRPGLVYRKRINGHFFYVEEILGKDQLAFRTAYKRSAGVGATVAELAAPERQPGEFRGTSSVPEAAQSVNPATASGDTGAVVPDAISKRQQTTEARAAAQAEFQQAAQKLKDAVGKTKLSAVLPGGLPIPDFDPELIAHGVEFTRAAVKLGIATAKEISAALEEHLGQRAPNYTRAVLDSYRQEHGGLLGDTAADVARARSTKPDVELHLNWDKIQGPDDLREWARRNYPEYSAKVEAQRRGVRTDEQVREEARAAGFSVDEIKRMRAGSTLNDADLLALSHLTKDLRDKAYATAQEYAATPTDENLVRARAAQMEWQAAHATFSGARAEAGRSLRALRQIANTTDARYRVEQVHAPEQAPTGALPTPPTRQNPRARTQTAPAEPTERTYRKTDADLANHLAALKTALGNTRVNLGSAGGALQGLYDTLGDAAPHVIGIAQYYAERMPERFDTWAKTVRDALPDNLRLSRDQMMGLWEHVRPHEEPAGPTVVPKSYPTGPAAQSGLALGETKPAEPTRQAPTRTYPNTGGKTGALPLENTAPPEPTRQAEPRSYPNTGGKTEALPGVETSPTQQGFGAANTVYPSADAADALATLTAKSKLGPADLRDLRRLGGYYVEGGARTLGEWTKAMQADLGSRATPEQLKSVWETLRPETEQRVKTLIRKDQAMAKMANALGGQEMNDEALRKLAAVPADNPIALAKFLRDQHQAPLAEKILSVFKLGLLSNPLIPVRKGLADVAITGLQPVERLVRAGVDTLRPGPREFYPGESSAMVRGYLGSAREAGRALGQTLLHGFSERVAADLEIPRWEPGGGIANPLNWVPRATGAVNEAFTVLNYNGELHALARRQVLKEGLRGASAQTRFGELLQDADLQQAAMKRARQLTWKGDTDSLLQGVNKLRGARIPGTQVQPGQWLLPFLKTHYEMVKEGAKYSPLGLADLKAPVSEAKPGQVRRVTGLGSFADTRAAARAQRVTTVSKTLTGSAIMLGAAALAARGLLTGAAPKDRKEQAEFYANGLQPNSVKIGDRWVGFDRLGAAAVPFILTANLYDEMRRTRQAPDPNKVKAAYLAVKNSLLEDPSAMKGLSSAWNAIEDPGKYGDGFVAGLSRSVVVLPGALGLAARATDPHQRQPDAKAPLGTRVKQQIESEIPGLSQRVPPRTTKNGEPIRKVTGPAALSPLPVSLPTGARNR